MIDLPSKKTLKRNNTSNSAQIVNMTAIKEEDENEEDFQQYIDHDDITSLRKIESYESEQTF